MGSYAEALAAGGGGQPNESVQGAGVAAKEPGWHADAGGPDVVKYIETTAPGKEVSAVCTSCSTQVRPWNKAMTVCAHSPSNRTAFLPNSPSMKFIETAASDGAFWHSIHFIASIGCPSLQVGMQYNLSAPSVWQFAAGDGIDTVNSWGQPRSYAIMPTGGQCNVNSHHSPILLLKSEMIISI